jgi:hypothetical protein
LLDLEIKETYNVVINHSGLDSFDIIILDDKYIKISYEIPKGRDILLDLEVDDTYNIVIPLIE